MSEFGTNFRKARESLGISLNTIAIETRIGTRFLQAIENEEFHLLPGGIFNRGFIRSYAERIGLDPEQAVADYERLSGYREPVEALKPARPVHSGRSRWGLYPVAIGALILLIIVFYVVTRDSGTAITVSQAPEIATPVAASSEPLPAPEVSQPPPLTETEQVPPDEVVAPVAKPDALALEIEVREATWVKLIADGTQLVAEVLQPGTMRRFTAQTSINLTIGNAGGLVLKINDRQIESLGRSGQVREFNITPENLNDIFG